MKLSGSDIRLEPPLLDYLENAPVCWEHLRFAVLLLSKGGEDFNFSIHVNFDPRAKWKI